jgi:hypothetical protein
MDRQEFQKAWGRVVARAWEDESFKARLLAAPAAVLKDYGFEVPANIRIRVVENNEEMIHLRCTQQGAPEYYLECTSSCYRRPETESQMQIWSIWQAGWRTGLTVSLGARG